jgi:tetratricopeptide (TPR) repeat protein
LVSALVQEEPSGPAPTRATDVEALQLHVGVRYLLLAPLYGYSLRQLTLVDGHSHIEVLHDGVEETYQLPAFRARLRTHVREELDRVQRGGGRGAIDLARVPEAEKAALSGDHVKVLELLGAWPAPLAIFLRTPEGQMLGGEARATIARALGLLGSSCIALAETEKGEEVLRLAVQYAGDGPAAPEIYTRLGNAMIEDGRPGEAISPLRRAANLGADGKVIWPALAKAFLARERYLAALAALIEAREAGAATVELSTLEQVVHGKLMPSLIEWQQLVGRPADSRVGVSP